MTDILKKADALSWWAVISLLGVTLWALAAGYAPEPSVTHTDAEGEQDQLLWVWLDNVSVYTEPVGLHPGASGTFSGTLPDYNEIWLENTIGDEVAFYADGELIYDGTSSGTIAIGEYTGTPFELLYTVPSTSLPVESRLGLMHVDRLGVKHVIASWQYQPEIPVQQTIPRGAFWLGLLLMVGVIVMSANLSRIDWLVMLGVAALSGGLQLVMLWEKFAYNENIWTMATTWDNYVARGREWLLDFFPIAGQEAQQGAFIFLGALQMLVGPDIRVLYLVYVVLAVISVAMLSAVTMRLYGRWAGVGAGLLAAVFAPLIHYQQTLQPIPLILLCLIVLLVLLHAYQQGGHVRHIFWAGVVVGLGMVVRGSFALMLGWVLVIIATQMHLTWRRQLMHGALSMLAFALALSPVIITNFNAGFYMLTPSQSGIQLFRSNNLDSMGLNTHMRISEEWARARGRTDWTQLLLEDIQQSPVRVIELTLRRFGLLWDAAEHSDSGMIDYERNSLQDSPATRLLSLNGAISFRTLMLLGVFGAAAMLVLRYWLRALWLVTTGAVFYAATLLPFYTLGRLRIGIAVFLIVLIAGGAAALWEMRHQRGRWLRGVGAGLVVTISLSVVAGWLVASMPRPIVRAVDDIPPMLRINANYNDEIRLLGYDGYDTDHASYITFRLHWEALTSPAEDYVVTVRFVDVESGEIESIYNAGLGTTRPPAYPPTQWQTGDVFAERYFIHIDDDLAMNRAYVLYVGLYSQEASRPITLLQSDAIVLDDHARLTALKTGDAPDTPSVTAEPVIVWADTLALTEGTCQRDDETINVRFTWQALRRAETDHQLFIHLLDADGNLLDQQDTFLDQHDPLDAWQTGQTLTTEHTFEHPDGVAIRIGFYRPVTIERWAITQSSVEPEADTVQFACR